MYNKINRATYKNFYSCSGHFFPCRKEKNIVALKEHIDDTIVIEPYC